MFTDFWMFIVNADPTFATAFLLMLVAFVVWIVGFGMFFGPSMASRELTAEEERGQKFGCGLVVVAAIGAVLTFLAIVV